ncbi:hypothetical protein [Halegenticoccus soli]|uniref:hypothetical protein n=1 Tax=Halegenticoccus soli TaxID=1985678 RepID=UPI0018ECE42D|nr:hypothetical protein [Halegenticoccus soli]
MVPTTPSDDAITTAEQFNARLGLLVREAYDNDISVEGGGSVAMTANTPTGT